MLSNKVVPGDVIENYCFGDSEFFMTKTSDKAAERLAMLKTCATGSVAGRKLCAGHAAVLWALHAFIGNNDDDTCWPSIRTLMAATTLSERNLYKVLRELDDAKYIRKCTHKNKHAYKWVWHNDIVAATEPQKDGSSAAQTLLHRHPAPQTPCSTDTPTPAPQTPPTCSTDTPLEDTEEYTEENTSTTVIDDSKENPYDIEKAIEYWEAQELQTVQHYDESELEPCEAQELQAANVSSDSSALLPTPKAPAPPAPVSWAEAVAVKSAVRKATRTAKSTADNAHELDQLAQMLVAKWPSSALQAGLPAIRPAVRRAWQQSKLALPAFVHDLTARLQPALDAWATWAEATPPSQTSWLAEGRWAAPVKSFAKSSSSTSKTSTDLMD